MSMETLPTISADAIDALAGMSCDGLAEIANDTAAQYQQRLHSTAIAGLMAGAALNAAKEQVRHGEWEQWKADNWKFSPSWGRKLMQAAKRYCSSVLNREHLRGTTITALLADMSSESDSNETPSAAPLPESYDAPIEVTAREPERPAKSVGVKVKKPKAIKSFVLEDRIDEDRSAILDLAGEYADHEVLPDFLKMVKSTVKQIEQEAAR